MNAHPAKGRIAYIVSRYPFVSHTFVLREVMALRARGLDISTVTVRRPAEDAVISPLDHVESLTTHAILPTTAGGILRAHASALRQSPTAYARTLLETIRDGGRTVRGFVWQLFYFNEAILLWKWLLEQELRHVHAHHANVAADLAMIATRFANRHIGGRRYIWSVTVHGPADFAADRAPSLALKVRRADAVVAISEFARDQLTALDGVGNGARIEVIHCGIDPDDYEAVDRGVASNRPLRVLSVARLEPRKGQEILLEALGQLRRAGEQVELTIVGDGPCRQSLATRATELGLEEWVSFAGAVGQHLVADFYEQADVFCLPSFAEGVPMVLMEAMAGGLPVVATRIAGIPELVEDGHSGLLVSPGHPRALAAALARLIRDPVLAAYLGANARQKVVSEFALADSAAALEHLFFEVAASPPSRQLLSVPGCGS